MTVRRRGLFYVLGAALFVSACAVQERHVTTVERRWPAAGIETVDVQGIDGSLSVEAGSADEITLVARVRARGVSPGSGPNLGYFKSDLYGDTLRIGQRKKRIRVGFPFLARPKVSIDYELRVPPSVALDLKTVNGRITTRGVEGSTELVTINGVIDAEVAGKNEMTASAINGRIRATFLRDFTGARLKTVNGRVEARLPSSASFTCNLSQVNGDFEASFPLSIHSHPGSRRVSGEVNGGQYELHIVTVNGDVDVEHVQVPQVDTPPALPPAPSPPPPPPPIS